MNLKLTKQKGFPFIEKDYKFAFKIFVKILGFVYPRFSRTALFKRDWVFVIIYDNCTAIQNSKKISIFSPKYKTLKHKISHNPGSLALKCT